MPTINVNRDELFKRLGRIFTEKEFDDLCFEFGIELDEVTSEKQIKAKEQGVEQAVGESEDVIYRIEIPANRYDLLCIEGLTRALNIFLEKSEIPKYKLSDIDQISELTVLPNTKQVRPYVIAAILRNVKFTKLSYDSFIDLQDKLHHNICRKRTLVSVGTHDLDTVKPPFFYDAQKPETIEFVPLKQNRKFNAKELLDFYLNDEHLKVFVPIIKDSPVYPVVYDSNKTVLSLPPIINSEHSKITLNTKNIFIECTACDLHKASIVLDTLVCMFSEYCSDPFTIEPVKVNQSDGTSSIYPKLKYRHEILSLDYINMNLGINIEMDYIQRILKKMSLESTKSGLNKVDVLISPVRQDILHSCDILEDIGIGYGYNNIHLLLPQSLTIASQYLLNKISDQIRNEVARCGFTEIFTFSLCSRDDIGSKMRYEESLDKAIKISNPKTSEFQVARTSLIPGLLKTLASNKKMPLPLKLFEVSDVLFKDENYDVRAKNERFLSVIFYNKNSGFEVIHGLLDRVMDVLKIPIKSNTNPKGYFLRTKNDNRFLDGRCAEILIDNKIKGIMGILHPEVVLNFDLSQPCSALEISIQEVL